MFKDWFLNIENILIDDQISSIDKDRQISGRNLNGEAWALVFYLFDNWHTISVKNSQIESFKLGTSLYIQHSDFSSCLSFIGCCAMDH